MTSRRTGLGRNLNALLGDKVLSHAASALSPATETASHTQLQLRNLPVDYLQPGKFQPRRTMMPEALQELSESIRAQGIIQPIVVRHLADRRYEIIAGERRWRAAKLAGLTEVPVIVKQAEDKAVVALALIENIQREDLNPIDQARALQRLLDEFSLTHKQIAEAVGKSRAAVSNLLRLISLHGDVIAMIEAGQLDMGHARALLSLEKPEQLQLAQLIVQKQMSVRQTEQQVRRLLHHTVETQEKPTAPIEFQQLQRSLSQKLGTQVAIESSGKGKGKLVIHFASLDNLKRILEKI